LGRLLAELIPDEEEVLGLLALMLLVNSRQRTRSTPEGELVLLADQDRSQWDRALIAEGQAIVRECLRRNRPGPYQIQAAINAVHSDAVVADATDWHQILQLYDQLLVVMPTPVASLNRAVALAEVEGATTALAILESITLDDYYLFHAVRADLLSRIGENEQARSAYDAAIALTSNEAERTFLARARAALPE
jgi:RNA polymerase sigma-70 factor (ECF subfamily)